VTGRGGDPGPAAVGQGQRSARTARRQSATAQSVVVDGATPAAVRAAFSLLESLARGEIAVVPRTDDGDSGPETFTIAEALAATPETLDSLPLLGHDGYIVRSWAHLLAGFWRIGKSELMTAIVIPWLRLGMRVLWLTEEPQTLWGDRARRSNEIYAAVPWENVLLVKARTSSPAQLLAFAQQWQGDVVIVDTIARCCGVQDLGDPAVVERALRPWVALAETRTVILIAQHRKAPGQHGERVLGSVEFGATFDVVLEVERVDGAERRRKLTCERRGEPAPPLLYEMDEDGRILVVPDGRSRNRVDLERDVLTVVNASAEPMTTVEARRRLDPPPSRDTVLRALTTLAEGGLVLREPPLSESAAGRTVLWKATSAAQPTQLSSPYMVDLVAEVDAAEVETPPQPSDDGAPPCDEVDVDTLADVLQLPPGGAA
jgi:hypothetical protein